MNNVLTIFINDEPVFERERDINLEQSQLEFLEKMDSDMDRGIKISGESYENPSQEQRLTFVAMNLIKALQQENDAVIAASCAYLIQRRPDLIEVRASNGELGVNIELISEDVH